MTQRCDGDGASCSFKGQFVAGLSGALVTLGLGGLMMVSALDARAEQPEPFPDDDEVLAVDRQEDGSSSIRVAGATMHVSPCLLRVSLRWRETSLPSCVFVARVISAAHSGCRRSVARLARRGRRYRFAPSIELRDGEVDLNDALTRQNLGACYYLPRTELLVEVGGVDFKQRRLEASRIYLADRL
jgi:hypothetical protein